jgi:hypothetical protein
MGLLMQLLAGDVVAEAFARQQHSAVGALPVELSHSPVSRAPLVGVDVTGIETLRAVVAGGVSLILAATWSAAPAPSNRPVGATGRRCRRCCCDRHWSRFRSSRGRPVMATGVGRACDARCTPETRLARVHSRGVE